MVTNKMSKSSRLELLQKAKKRYLKSSKQEKIKILDELVLNTKMNRKYINRLLSAKVSIFDPEKKVINKKRKCKYTKQDILCLSKIWEILDYPCGQRLQPALGETIKVLVAFKELTISKETITKLKKIGISTIDTRLKPYKEKLLKKFTNGTKQGTVLKKQIPIKTSSWQENKIGFGELDCVIHCGNSAGGEFVSSLDFTDILTQWTETDAVMGKAQSRIIKALDKIESRLPFPLKGIDPDNGSEFINWQLYNHCLKKQIEFTRGRPYHKNDNAHIEQKNWTNIRKVFGYRRFDTEEQLNLINDLYGNELRNYKNFFIPNIKLTDKKRVGKNQEKIKRIYDKAKTPYQRVMECDQIDKKSKKELQATYEKLNPAQLRRDVLAKLAKLKKMKSRD